MEKQEMMKILKSLGVKVSHLLGEEKMKALFDKELEERGMKFRDGEVWRTLTKEDLDSNPELAQEGFVEGDEVGLGRLESASKANDTGKENDNDGTDSNNQSQANSKVTTTDTTGKIERVMLENVKHNGSIYKKGTVVYLGSELDKLFTEKKWVAAK